MDDRAKQRIECWRAEANSLLSAERAALALGTQVLNVTLVVAVAGASYGVAQNHGEVLLALPVVFSLIASYTLQIFGDVAAMGAARLRIERRLNEELLAPVAVYDTVVAPLRTEGFDPSQVSIKVLYVLLFLAVSVAAFAWAPTPEPHGDILWWISLLLTAVGVLTTGLAGSTLRKLDSAVDETWSRETERVSGETHLGGLVADGGRNLPRLPVEGS